MELAWNYLRVAGVEEALNCRGWHGPGMELAWNWRGIGVELAWNYLLVAGVEEAWNWRGWYEPGMELAWNWCGTVV